MSTPISQLRNEGDNSQMVDGILSQLEQEDGAPQHRQQMPQQQQQPQQMEDEYEEYEDYYDQVQERQLSASEQMISEFKLPLLVVFLVFLTNFGMVNDMLLKNIPRLGGDGELNMMGLMVKALVAGVVFYLVKKFVL